MCVNINSETRNVSERGSESRNKYEEKRHKRRSKYWMTWKGIVMVTESECGSSFAERVRLQVFVLGRSADPDHTSLTKPIHVIRAVRLQSALGQSDQCVLAA